MGFIDLVTSILNNLTDKSSGVSAQPAKDVLVIKVTRLISNSNGQFDSVKIMKNNTVVWSGVAGENNVLTNCPIAPGQYHLQWYDSPAEGYQDLILINVPLHNFIEMHVGNYPNHNPNHTDGSGDSKGCLLIAGSFDDVVNPTMVCDSVAYFSSFKSNLPQDLNDVVLVIS